MKKTLVFVIAFFVLLEIEAQITKEQFRIEGTIKGKLKIPLIRLATSFKDTSGVILDTDSSVIKDNKFSFSGCIAYPQAFHFWYEDSSIYISSNIFFVDGGMQHIDIDTDSISNKTPSVSGSKTHAEYVNNFHPLEYETKEAVWFLESEKLIDRTEKKLSLLSEERRLLFLERDSVLLADAKLHRGTIIPIWLMLRFMHRKGFNSCYFDVLNTLDSSYRNTSVGKYLTDNIYRAVPYRY